MHHHKVKNLFFACLLLLSFSVNAQQSEVKQSEAKTLHAVTWVVIQDHDKVSFSGQLSECDGNQILKLKAVNRNSGRIEVRAGFLNGSKRLTPLVFVLQPHQELVLDCSGPQGPIFLTDGTSIKIDTQIIQLN